MSSHKRKPEPSKSGQTQKKYRLKKKELEEYVDARNAMRVAVSRKYTKELKESLEGTSNDTKALRSIKKAMIKNHEAPFDISENGKKLPQ
jgi:uncharacterized protein YaiL (DUF2058 family)